LNNYKKIFISPKRVVATPHPGAQRFVVNWKSNEGETLFHFNPRFDVSQKGMEWINEIFPNFSSKIVLSAMPP
jgi:hypothetical protein